MGLNREQQVDPAVSGKTKIKSFEKYSFFILFSKQFDQNSVFLFMTWTLVIWVCKKKIYIFVIYEALMSLLSIDAEHKKNDKKIKFLF